VHESGVGCTERSAAELVAGPGHVADNDRRRPHPVDEDLHVVTDGGRDASYRASHVCSVCRDTFHCPATSPIVRPSAITAKIA